MVIAEIMQFDEEVDYMVSEGANRKKILDYSKSKGFVTMDEDGIEKVVRGLTDFDELMRVVNLTHVLGLKSIQKIDIILVNNLSKGQ